MLSVTFLCVFSSAVAVRGASHGIDVTCDDQLEQPDADREFSPSLLSQLRVNTVGHDRVNISWAVNVDASLRYMTGTRIGIDSSFLLCTYDPPLAKANLTGLTEVWFHYQEEVFPGLVHIQAANLPLPLLGSGPAYTSVTVRVPYPITTTTSDVYDMTTLPTPESFITTPAELPHHREVSTTGTIAAIGGLLGIMSLTCCFLTCKRCRAAAGKASFTKLSPGPPVAVLLVYPPESPSFQRAVVALAEFLQVHGGCNVAVDLWQQASVAELGPLRWLAERARTADRVLVVCPQPLQLSQRSSPGPLRTFPIPASAYDLYPLVLNMVAGLSWSSKELSRFCAVQLGEHRAVPPPELAACRSFSLMTDLPSLCKSLHAHQWKLQKIKTPWALKAISGSDNAKLSQAVRQLAQCQQPSSVAMAPKQLHTLVTFPASSTNRL